MIKSVHLEKFTGTFFIYFFLVLGSLFALFPLLWMLSTSLKPLEETFLIPPDWIPKNITFQSYRVIWTDYNFPIYFKNSIIVVVSSTLVATAFSILSGYGVSRFNFRGKASFLYFLLLTQMLPSVLLVVPYFQVLRALGLYNTLGGLTIAYISFALPFCSWMMKGFFDGIPKELDEAAEIDGASKLRTLIKVILPLSAPGVVATMIFSFVLGWNEYLFALTLAGSENVKTVSVGIGSMIGQYKVAWNDMMAVSVVATIPLIVVFVFLQKYLVQGLTAGAVKE